MQPTDLKAIARDAALRGDTKTLFHTLDLLERLMPIATFMDFCTELDELRLQGEPTAALRRSELRQYSSILPAPADRDNCPSLSGCMAAKTKCLAHNKRRTSAKPTIITSLHPG